MSEVSNERLAEIVKAWREDHPSVEVAALYAKGRHPHDILSALSELQARRAVPAPNRAGGGE